MIEQETSPIPQAELEEKPEDQAVNSSVEVTPKPEVKELTKEELALYSRLAVETILGREVPDLTPEQVEKYQEFIEQSIIEGVIGLPEMLAGELGTVNPEMLNSFANELVKQMESETDPHRLSDLQIELIFQNIALTSRVQNGGSKGFLPSVAREVKGLDCSLSAHILHQKLLSQKVPQLKYAFGYPVGHAVGIVTVADGRRLYVDAQNGFVSEVTLHRVYDEEVPETAYPIYEIVATKRLTGHLPGEGKVKMTSPTGSDYQPKYLGVRQDGTMHTLSNMHMLVHPDSPTFYTETGKKFRQSLGMPELSPQAYEAAKSAISQLERGEIKEDELDDHLRKDAPDQYGEIGDYIQGWESHYSSFQRLVSKVAGGKYLEETRFMRFHAEHREEFEKEKGLSEEREKLQLAA